MWSPVKNNDGYSRWHPAFWGGQFLWSSGAQYMLLNSTVGCEEALPREDFQEAVVFLWGERGACHPASLCSNLICNSEELWNTSVTLTVVPGMLLLSSHFLQHQSWFPPGNIYFCMSSWSESCFYHDQDPIVPRGNELISTHRSPTSTDALSSITSVSPYIHAQFCACGWGHEGFVFIGCSLDPGVAVFISLFCWLVGLTGALQWQPAALLHFSIYHMWVISQCLVFSVWLIHLVWSPPVPCGSKMHKSIFCNNSQLELLSVIIAN